MDQMTVTIKVEDFMELVKAKARLEVCENFIKSEDYVSKKDICKLLGIPTEE